MSKELQLIVDAQNVAVENAQQLIEAFGAPFTEAGEILSSYKEIVVSDESQTDLMKEAREKRLVLKKIRTTVESKRKVLKENALRTGKAIDGVAKYIRDNIQPAEDYLELQEKYAEVKKAEELARLKAERTSKLSNYTEDTSAYNLDTMSDESFEVLYKDLKNAHEYKIKLEELAVAEAKKTEAERVERERVLQEENARLQAEAKQKSDELAKIANEQRLKVEAEAKAKRDAEQAPDKEKIVTFSKALETIRTEKLPVVESQQAKNIVLLIDEMLIKMRKVIDTKIEEL